MLDAAAKDHGWRCRIGTCGEAKVDFVSSLRVCISEVRNNSRQAHQHLDNIFSMSPSPCTGSDYGCSGSVENGR